MTYTTAFVMVGRVFIWIALILSVPFLVWGWLESIDGDKREQLTTSSSQTFFLFVLWISAYTAVILCARYVQ